MPTDKRTQNSLAKEEIMAGDDLDLFLDREVILLGGDQSSGKTISVAALCLDGLEQGFQVVVVDRDRGIAKAIKEIYIEGKIPEFRERLEALGMFGKKPENLTYFLGDRWEKINEAVKYGFNMLGAGDWFVMEQVGRLWDMAQTEYSRKVYGEELSNHLLTLRTDAQKALDAAGISTRSRDDADKKKANQEVSRSMAYSGMEGRTDWSVIKRMHNDDVRDRLILEGNFNLLLTTSMKPLAQDEVQKWSMFTGITARPEGESHNVYIVDTVAVAYQKWGKFYWRTDMGNKQGKDRGGRPLVKDVDCTGIGFVESYMQHVAEG